MRGLLLAVVLGWGSAAMAAGANAVVQMEFSHPGLVPARWSLELHPDGRGHFKTERGDAPRVEDGLEAPDIDRDVQLSAQYAEHVFAIAAKKRYFRMECESHAKVAFQGAKRLSYTGESGQGSCEFNYSKDQEIQQLGDSLESVATTLIEGARLEILRKHDPLGLDKEMERLTDSVSDGRAKQIGSIRAILVQLSEDPAVMERVRKRARGLLDRAEN